MRHVQECRGVNVNALLVAKRYTEAIVALANISRDCLGRPYANVFRELGANGALPPATAHPEVEAAPPVPLPTDPEAAPD